MVPGRGRASVGHNNSIKIDQAECVQPGPTESVTGGNHPAMTAPSRVEAVTSSYHGSSAETIPNRLNIFGQPAALLPSAPVVACAPVAAVDAAECPRGVTRGQ